MMSLFKKRLWIATLSLTLANLLAISQAVAEVAVIVHPSNTSTIEKTDIKHFFLGKTRAFSNDRKAILLSSDKNNPITEEFNQKVLGKSNGQVNAYWSKILFTGKGTPPQEMATSAEMLSAISANPDGIGYIDAGAVTDAVKVIATF